MEWQAIAVYACIALAVGVVIRAAWRAMAGQGGGCGAACKSCGSEPPPVPGRIGLPQV